MDLDNPDVTEKGRRSVLVRLYVDEGAVDGFSQSVLVAVGPRKKASMGGVMGSVVRLPA